MANAVGPLAAINDAVINGGISAKAGIPLWVMAVGAIGIAIGLALYGPKLIRTVGGEITELDQMRAFSVAMAASITVIIASQLGLPVSSYKKTKPKTLLNKVKKSLKMRKKHLKPTIMN